MKHSQKRILKLYKKKNVIPSEGDEFSRSFKLLRFKSSWFKGRGLTAFEKEKIVGTAVPFKVQFLVRALDELFLRKVFFTDETVQRWPPIFWFNFDDPNLQ